MSLYLFEGDSSDWIDLKYFSDEVLKIIWKGGRHMIGALSDLVEQSRHTLAIERQGTWGHSKQDYSAAPDIYCSAIVAVSF